MDYSPFYFRYNKKTDEDEAPSFYDYECSPEPRRKRKKGRDYLGAIFVILIIVPVLAVLIFADVRTGGSIKTAVSRLLNNDTYVFYMVVRGGYDSERDASAHASVTRGAGGAGYIYTQDGQYFVALATYLSKKEAKSVSDKNDGTIVKECKLKAGELYKGTYGDLYKRTVECIYDSVTELYEASEKLDAHSLSEEEVLAVCSKIRDTAYDVKSDILDIPSGSDKESLLAMIEPLFGGTEAITTIADESTLAPAIRYVICSTISNTQRICE